MNHNPLLEKAFSPRLHRAVRIAFPRSWMGRMGEKLAHKLSWGALYPVTLIWLVLYQLWNLLPLTATVTLLTVQSLVAGWVFKNLLQREPDISVPPFTNRPVNAGMLYEFARRTGFTKLRTHCLLFCVLVVAILILTVWIREPSASPMRWMLWAASVVLGILSSAGLWLLVECMLNKLESIWPAAELLRHVVIFIIGFILLSNLYKLRGSTSSVVQTFPQASIFRWLLEAGAPPSWKLLFCFGLICPLLLRLIEFWRNRPPLPEPEFFSVPFEPSNNAGSLTLAKYHLLGAHPGGNHLVDDDDDYLEDHTAEPVTHRTSNEMVEAAPDPVDALPPKIAKLNLRDQLAKLPHTDEGTQSMKDCLDPIYRPLLGFKSISKAWFYAGLVLVFSLWLAAPISTWSEGLITAWFDLKPRSLVFEAYFGSVAVLLGLGLFLIVPVLDDVAITTRIYQPLLHSGLWLKLPLDPRDSTQFDIYDKRQILDKIKILAAGVLGVWLAVGVVWMLERYTGLHFSGHRDKLTLRQVYLGGGGTLCAAHVWLPIVGLFILLHTQRPRRSTIALSSRVRWQCRFRFLAWLQGFLTIINHACCFVGLFVACFALLHWSAKAVGGALLLWTAPFGLSILHEIILRHLQDHGRGDFIPTN